MLRHSIVGLSGAWLAQCAFGVSRCDSAKVNSSQIERPKPAIKPVPLNNKTVLITGATAGIGLACVWRFAEEGCKLVLVGRRKERLDNIKTMLKEDFPAVRVHTVAMSVSDVEKVAALPSELPADLREVDILVNNAGLALGVSSVETNSISDAMAMLDTNVLGVVAFCRAFMPSMVERGAGHVINVGSCAGHVPYPTGTVYNASKFAVHGFSAAARADMAHTPVRITEISPGIVGNTEFSNVRMKNDDKASKVYSSVVPLYPEDVADNIVYAATRPPHVQVADILMYATNQSGPRDICRVGPSLGKK